MGITKGMMSSNTDEWATPKTFFDELNKKYNFTLDPCATNENHKCKKYFTKEQDGLKQNWGGKLSFVIHPMVEKYQNG